jgi:hypothetical protein
VVDQMVSLQKDPGRSPGSKTVHERASSSRQRPRRRVDDLQALTVSVLVMVGLHSRVSAHERMLRATAARVALSVASVMRGSGIFLRLPGSPAGLTS